MGAMAKSTILTFRFKKASNKIGNSEASAVRSSKITKAPKTPKHQNTNSVLYY